MVTSTPLHKRRVVVSPMSLEAFVTCSQSRRRSAGWRSSEAARSVIIVRSLTGTRRPWPARTLKGRPVGPFGACDSRPRSRWPRTVHPIHCSQETPRRGRRHLAPLEPYRSPFRVLSSLGPEWDVHDAGDALPRTSRLRARPQTVSITLGSGTQHRIHPSRSLRAATKTGSSRGRDDLLAPAGDHRAVVALAPLRGHSPACWRLRFVSVASRGRSSGMGSSIASRDRF